MTLKRRAAVFVFSAVLAFFMLLVFFRYYPVPGLDEFLGLPVSTRVLDRNGVLIASLPLPGGPHREAVDLNRVPDAVLRCFLAAEDRRFYYHSGVDIISLTGALWRNISAGRRTGGGSTITMQLARIIIFKYRENPISSGERKALEILYAFCLEARLTKDEILRLWLTHIPFSGPVEGLSSAARYFFSSETEKLNAPEGLILSVIPRNPSVYDPIKNPERVKKAALRVRDSGSLSIEEFEVDRALERLRALRDSTGMGSSQPPDNEGSGYSAGKGLPPGSAAFWPDRAPHFTRYLAGQGLLAGPVPELKTTLDLNLNLRMEAELSKELRLVPDRRINQGAVLAADARTGEIIVYIGSGDFYGTRDGQIDGVRIKSQPGSCLKPFLYALALEEGRLANDILPDLPSEFGGSPAYIPRNFNQSYHGPVRFRVALASSLNIPAVLLLSEIGAARFFGFLQDAGFSLEGTFPEETGLGLALGNGRVSLFEMVRAYTAFSGDGTVIPLCGIINPGENGAKGKIKDTAKPGLTSGPLHGNRILTPYSAGLVRDILSDESARYLGFGASSQSGGERRFYIKTGTANQFQHIWAMAGGRRYIVGVWMGNFSGETVLGITGSSLPARLAHNLLERIERPEETLPEPPYVKRVEICSLSGQSPGPYCSHRIYEYLPLDVPDPPLCTWHLKDGVEYPGEYSLWLETKNRQGYGRGEMRILRPEEGALFFYDPSIPAEKQAVKVEASGGDLGPVEVYVNDRWTSAITHPYSWFFPLPAGEKGLFTIEFRSPETSSTVTVEVR